MIVKRIHDALVGLLHLERRIDPLFRPAFDAVLQEPLTRLTQALIDRYRDQEPDLAAHETALPGESALMEAIVAEMADYMRAHYRPGRFERAGNTKTHGVVASDVNIYLFVCVLFST